MLAPYKRDIGLYVFAHTKLCSYPFQLMILFCFNNSDIFCIAVHISRNLFRKTFPLFGKMFSPSSYSGKMRNCINNPISASVIFYLRHNALIH